MDWLPILLISGLCSTLSFCATYPTHYLVETPQNWNDALQYCKDHGSRLAKILNMEELRALLPLMGDQADVWLGARSSIWVKLHWSLVDDDFYKPGEEDYRNINPIEQNGYAYFAENGLWDSSTPSPDDPAVKMHAMCYDANKQGRDRYVLVEQLLQYYEAINYCRDNHTDLVSIRNPTENQIINEVSSGQKVWIGLFNDNLLWMDMTLSAFRFWQDDHEPWFISNNHCLYIATLSGKWKMDYCSTKRRFFCSRVKRTTELKVRVNSKGLLDLNDPAIKEAALEQIRQLMEGLNFTNGHTLTWKTQPDGAVFTKEEGHDNKRT